MNRNEWAARADHWKAVVENCALFDEIRRLPDGAIVRNCGVWGDAVREPSGFVCSPIAYSVRKELSK